MVTRAMTIGIPNRVGLKIITHKTKIFSVAGRRNFIIYMNGKNIKAGE